MKILLVVALACVGLTIALPQRTAPVQFPGQCKVCTDAVEIMEILLKDYGPEEAVVKAAIEGICAKLPLWSDQCKSIVDTVIDFIDQNKAPEDIVTLSRSVLSLNFKYLDKTEIN